MIVMMGYIHLEPFDVPEFLADLEAIAAGTRAERGVPLLRHCLRRRTLRAHAVGAAMAGPRCLYRSSGRATCCIVSAKMGE